MGSVAIREGIGSQSSAIRAGFFRVGLQQQGPLRVNDSHSGRLCVFPPEQTALGYRAPLVGFAPGRRMWVPSAALLFPC